MLLSFSFEPVGKWYLAPLALAVHICALNRSNQKALSIFTFAFAFNACVLHWTSIYVGSAPWIILGIGLSALYVPLILVKRWGIASYPLLFVIAEEIRNRFPFGGFGWARIAYSQADAPYAKIATYGGAIALSGITALIALSLYLISQKQFRPLIFLPIVLILLPHSIQEDGQVKVLAVQGNVPQYGLDFNSRATQVFYNHVKETDRALTNSKDIDLIVWPENAVDVDPFKNKQVFESLNKYAEPLIIGAIVDNNGETLNTSILWTKKQQNVYAKQHLTPFGEYIPMRTLARKISP